MLKINNNFKKYKIPLAAALAIVGGAFLFQYLTFIPEYSNAEEITTPVLGEAKPDNRTLSQITYMQEMTSGICERSAENETKQLIDKRENKSYWVAKLKDGNCWMTQNLDLDLKSGTSLTPDDSDVTSDWDPEQTTITGTLSTDVWPIPVNTSSPTTDEANIVRSYDAGEYVYTNPTTSKSCNAGSAGLSGGTCAADGWVNVSGMAASSDPNFGTSVTNNTYNAHYLAGNRYSWAAATAGQSSSISNQYDEATQSICPKGWKLPLGGSNNNTENGFYKLIATSYGIHSGTSAYKKLVVSPLYFLAGGYVNKGSLYDAGGHGQYWSSTAVSDTRAYVLSFYSSYVYPSENGSRYVGKSIRCIARDNVPDVLPTPEIDNPNISVIVDKILTLEVTDKEVNIEPKTNEIMTGNFTATVSSNAGYDIQLSTTEDGNTALVNKKDNVVVAEIPASNNIQVGTNGWGIKCIDDENCMLKSYNALTLYNNPQVYFSSTTSATNKPTNFEVGIGISPSLPSGTYSTNILVTASQK